MIRSKEQHAYEWWCYRYIGEVIGETTYEVYLIFAKRLLSELDQDGELVIRKPTSLLDWEHQIYMEQIKFIVNIYFPRFLWPELKDLPKVIYSKY